MIHREAFFLKHAIHIEADLVFAIVGLMWHAFLYFQEKKQGARGDTLVCGACGQVGSVKQFLSCALLKNIIMFDALFSFVSSVLYRLGICGLTNCAPSMGRIQKCQKWMLIQLSPTLRI